MKHPKLIATELISDFIEMMPDGIDKIGYDFKTQYEVAKVQAEYAAHVAKFSHPPKSEKFLYFQNVQEEIKKL